MDSEFTAKGSHNVACVSGNGRIIESNGAAEESGISGRINDEVGAGESLAVDSNRTVSINFCVEVNG